MIMKYGNNNCSLNTVSIGLCHTTNYSTIYLTLQIYLILVWLLNF